MKIDKYTISNNHPPFIIAEMSGNHNQSLEKALQIVQEAANAGVNALKIQTYTADTMTMDVDSEYFTINDKNSLWNGRNLYDLYNEAHTPWSWHKTIFDKCAELGIVGFSSPFDETAVDFLEELNVPIYKIASFEITHLPLIKKVAQTKKPMIMSCGMSTLEEIKEAVKTAKENGAKDIILLKCTSNYPANASDANLSTISDMRKQFPDCIIGLSDHTMGIGVAVASVALGAKVIEKHFTLSRKEGGVDSAFSLEPQELKDLVTESNKAFNSIGKVQYGAGKSEQNSTKFRQSIWIKKDIKKGEQLTKDNLKICRPGHGLAPKYLDEVLGKKASNNISRGTPLDWKFIEE